MYFDPAQVSTQFYARERALRDARDALIEFSDRLSILDHLVCDCGKADCAFYSSREEVIRNVTVEVLLGAVANHWDPVAHPHQDEADPDQALAGALRHRLLSFGREFEIFVTPPRHFDTDPALLRFIDEEWHDQAGCHNHMPTPTEQQVVQRRLERNLRLLQLFEARLPSIPALQWRRAINVNGAIRDTAWHREAVHLANHSLATWMPGAEEHPVAVRIVEYHGGIIPASHAWDIDQALTFNAMLADLVRAVLTYRIVKPSVTDALSEPLALVLPLCRLDQQVPQEA